MKASAKKWGLRFLAVYLVLLALSHLYRAVRPAEPAPGPGQKVFAAAGHGGDEGREIDIAYRDAGPPGGVPLLLIHGSPVGSAVFDPLIAELPDGFRIIAPDLPGHGNSTLEFEDGSFEADASYLRQLLDHLGIRSAHLAACSRGGGPALLFWDADPERVRSLALLASIGVQEQELLGHHTLNHALYSLQYGFFVLLEELTPHFGYLDDAILNTAYARSFLDSDQRPLRGILSRIDVPVLVLHGRDDALVPLPAAREHLRIVPHGEDAILDGGHLLPVRAPDTVAAIVADFVRRADDGAARIRADADPARILAAAEAPGRAPGSPGSGAGLLFLALVLFLSTFASEDLTCVIAGILAAAGTLSYPLAVGICLAGILVGDLAVFLAGRFLGARAVRHAPFRWVLNERRLRSTEEWFHRRGAMVIVASRFLPGSRLAVYFTAGMVRVGVGKFLLVFVIAAALWTPLLVGLAMLLGNPLLRFFTAFEHYALLGLVGFILCLLILIKVALPLLTHRGRRLFYGRWRRIARWEFWPRWIFYPPVVLWVLWLGARHLRPALFTAANPGMPGGGIAFESKRAIHDRLEDGRGTLARMRALDPGGGPGTWMTEAARFQESLEHPWPLVCKPDHGERGDGVRIVRDPDELRRALEEADRPPLVQEFVPGLEFGVFFERGPGEERGTITSITRKIHTSVTGDGVRTLEELILDDDRAVCSHRYFRDRHRGRLTAIVPVGESFELADLGSHCRGSLFLDGNDLASPRLARAVDAIFAGTEGLCFGRLDVKCPSEDDFREGRNLTVLEFNGVTSEPTHIYDPAHSLAYAYRTLFAQWRRAFRMAARNREAGHRPWSKRRTLRLLVRAMTGSRG